MLARRTDPIVWGQDGIKGPLSASQVAQYEEDGFLLFPGLMAQLDSQLLQGCIDEAGRLQHHKNRESFITEEGSNAIRTIYNAHGLSDIYKRAVSTPFFVECGRQLLGSEIYLHQSHLNYKKAFFGKNFFWHQDFTFWHHEDGMPQMRTMAVILFLDNVGPENGPIMMIPGSHRWYSDRPWCRGKIDPNEAARHNLVDDIETNGLLSPDQVRFLSDGKEIFTAMGPAGTVLMYEGNTAHASGDNLSPRDRAIGLFFYNSFENQLVNPTRPDYIAERIPKKLLCP